MRSISSNVSSPLSSPPVDLDDSPSDLEMHESSAIDENTQRTRREEHYQSMEASGRGTRARVSIWSGPSTSQEEPGSPYGIKRKQAETDQTGGAPKRSRGDAISAEGGMHAPGARFHSPRSHDYPVQQPEDCFNDHTSLAHARFWDKLKKENEKDHNFLWGKKKELPWLKNQNEARRIFTADQIFHCRNEHDEIVGMSWYSYASEDLALKNGETIPKEQMIEGGTAVLKDYREYGIGKKLRSTSQRHYQENTNAPYFLISVYRYNEKQVKVQFDLLKKEPTRRYIGYDPESEMELFLRTIDRQSEPLQQVQPVSDERPQSVAEDRMDIDPEGYDSDEPLIKLSERRRAQNAAAAQESLPNEKSAQARARSKGKDPMPQEESDDDQLSSSLSSLDLSDESGSEYGASSAAMPKVYMVRVERGQKRTQAPDDEATRQVLLLDEYNREGATAEECLSYEAVSLLIGLTQYGMSNLLFVEGAVVLDEQVKAINRQIARKLEDEDFVVGKKRSEVPGASKSTLFLPDGFMQVSPGKVIPKSIDILSEAVERADKLDPHDLSLEILRLIHEYNYIGAGRDAFTEGDISRWIGWERDDFSSILSAKSNHRLQDEKASIGNRNIERKRRWIVWGERRCDQLHPNKRCFYLPWNFEGLVAHSGLRLGEFKEARMAERRMERREKYDDAARRTFVDFQVLNGWTDAEFADEIKVSSISIGKPFYYETPGITDYLAKKVNTYKRAKELEEPLLVVDPEAPPKNVPKGKVLWPKGAQWQLTTAEAMALKGTQAEDEQELLEQERRLPPITQVYLYNLPLAQLKFQDLLDVPASSLRNYIREVKRLSKRGPVKLQWALPNRMDGPSCERANNAKKDLAVKGRVKTGMRRKDDPDASDQILYWPSHFEWIKEMTQEEHEAFIKREKDRIGK